MTVAEHHKFPEQVKVTASGSWIVGMAVALEFTMNLRNNYRYMTFISADGTCVILGSDLLRTFDEMRNIFIMDYVDPRENFAGGIVATVPSEAELLRALRAYHNYRASIRFPIDYETKLGQASRQAMTHGSCILSLEIVATKAG